jgi:hypothetical protein
MRRIAVALTALIVAAGPAGAVAATPEYFPFPAGYGVSNFGVVSDEAGDVWFSASGLNRPRPGGGMQPTPSLARLRPSEAVPGTSAGISFFPTPDPPGVNCCANQLRSVTYNKVDHRLYYVRSDGNVGMATPSALVPGTSLGMSSFMLPGYQDLWDVAPGKGGGAWFTEYSSSNQAPDYHGGRIAFYDGGPPAEGPNVAIQNGNTSLNGLRYDSRPAGVAVAADGRPWFVESDPGNPGYRLASWAGAGDSYQEYLVSPCEAASPCSGSYTGTGLTDLAIAPDGGIWFTNVLNKKFGRFDPASQTMVQFTMASIGLGGGSPTRITAAPDGTLWMTSSQGFTNATHNAVVRILPAATPSAAPTATVYKTSPSMPPLGIGADDAGTIWFGLAAPSPPAMVGRLVGVAAPAPGGGPTPGGGGTGGGATSPAPAGTTPTPIVLKPDTVGTARLEPPQVGNGAINANQICVGPPEARCSLVYLIREHEYVTGFPSAKGRRKKPKPRVLGTKAVTLRGGQSAKVTVTLNKLGRRILKGKRKLKIDFIATQRLANGKTKVLTRKTLTMKAKAKHPARARAAAVKRGYYIEVKTQTYIQTNAAATRIASLTLPCVVDGQPSGANVLTSLKLSPRGAFSFDGKSTLRGLSNSVIAVKVSGRISGTKAKAKVVYPGAGVTCEDRSVSARYYGVNPQG